MNIRLDGPKPRSAAHSAAQRLSHLLNSLYWSLWSRCDGLHELAHRSRTDPNEVQDTLKRWLSRRLLSLPSILTITWLVTLYWGESSVFSSRVNSCQWKRWEQWPRGAAPHRLVFVSDPQLVDPHTYPGRPWPLSTLSVRHTDNYLRRSYSRIQSSLDPDTIIFLGDLFDGGREWSTPTSKSPEKRYEKYDDNYWLGEFDRFSSIFFKEWAPRKSLQHEVRPARRIIASLPGNHDLGFGDGIQIPVRDRFHAFFGEGNRIDIIGNHTFIQVDTVSLSAQDGSNWNVTGAIWAPTRSFLGSSVAKKNETIDRHMRQVYNVPAEKRLQHEATNMVDYHYDFMERRRREQLTADFPVILLTHVPLFRLPGTPCGPLREKWPPTPPPAGRILPVSPDPPNAIPFVRGYQYQNCLSRQTALGMIKDMGNAVEYAFSGDDHDYCDVLHRGYPSPGPGIREITVKALNWAMGVRHPGFVMVSLWNPIDSKGTRLRKGEKTLQTHLCLLPDQLGILIRYAFLIGISVVSLLIRAIVLVYFPRAPSLYDDAYFPGFLEKSSRPYLSQRRSRHQHSSSLAASTTSLASTVDDTAIATNLSARNPVTTRPRSASPLPSYGYNVDDGDQGDYDGYANGTTSNHNGRPVFRARAASGKLLTHGEPLTPRRRLIEMTKTWVWSVWRVAWVGLLWYVWLWNNG